MKHRNGIVPSRRGGVLGLALGLLPALACAQGIAPDLLEDVFPGAEGLGPIEGRPPAAEVRREGARAGYVFHTGTAIPAVGYTGKPIDILVGLGLDGVITGAHLIEQHEPILEIGISEERLQRFIDAHRGLDIDDPAPPSALADGGRASGVDVISGATISSLVMNDNIIRSARAVARARGLLTGGPAPGAIDLDFHEPALWSDLLADGSVVRREVERPASGAEPATLLIDLYATLANPPRIGRNLLGDKTYTTIAAGLDPGDALVLVAANGLYSFKGTAYTRTGEFDRVRVVQDGRTHTLRSGGHHRISSLVASAEAPEFREIGLFTIPAAEGFDLAEPWSLELVLDLPQPAADVPSGVEIPYRLPDKYLATDEPAEADGSGQTATAPTGAAPTGAAPTGAAPSGAASGGPQPAAPLWDPASSARLEEGIKVALLALTGIIVGFVAFLGLMQRSR